MPVLSTYPFTSQRSTETWLSAPRTSSRVTQMPPKTPPPVHRHSVSEIALALAQRPRSDPVSTVALTLNARGDVQIHVDVDAPDPLMAAKVAQDVFDVLCAKSPRQANGS